MGISELKLLGSSNPVRNQLLSMMPRLMQVAPVAFLMKTPLVILVSMKSLLRYYYPKHYLYHVPINCNPTVPNSLITTDQPLPTASFLGVTQEVATPPSQ